MRGLGVRGKKEIFRFFELSSFRVIELSSLRVFEPLSLRIVEPSSLRSSYAAADAETGCDGGEDADGDLDDPLDGFLLDFHKGLRG